MLEYKIFVQSFSPGFGSPCLVINIDQKYNARNVVSGLIFDDVCHSGGHLLNFLTEEVSGGKNVGDYYRSEGYQAKIVRIEEKKLVEVSFYLDDSYPRVFIKAADLKEILEAYIAEYDKFKVNPQQYIQDNPDRIVQL